MLATPLTAEDVQVLRLARTLLRSALVLTAKGSPLYVRDLRRAVTLTRDGKRTLTALTHLIHAHAEPQGSLTTTERS